MNLDRYYLFLLLFSNNLRGSWKYCLKMKIKEDKIQGENGDKGKKGKIEEKKGKGKRQKKILKNKKEDKN